MKTSGGYVNECSYNVPQERLGRVRCGQGNMWPNLTKKKKKENVLQITISLVYLTTIIFPLDHNGTTINENTMGPWDRKWVLGTTMGP